MTNKVFFGGSLVLLACAGCAASNGLDGAQPPVVTAAIVSMTPDTTAAGYVVQYRLTDQGPTNAVVDFCGTGLQRWTAGGWVSFDKGQCAAGGGGSILTVGRSMVLTQQVELSVGDSIRVLPVYGPNGTGSGFPDAFSPAAASAARAVPPL